MGIRDRTRRLEKRAGLDKEGPCPECGGRIVFAEHQPDGTVTYPFGGPCSTCGNRPADGTIGLIRVMLPGQDGREGTRAADARREGGDVWP
jgi:DNA-directed RNA polymerase subunit RPC12/RpoP